MYNVRKMIPLFLVIALSCSACSAPEPISPTPEPTATATYPPIDSPNTFESLLTSHGPHAPRSPLSTRLCGPPCFQGITPGVTTREDALANVRAHKEIFGECGEFHSQYVQGVACSDFLSFFFDKQNSQVIGIGFEPSDSLTLGQIVDRYGDPDKVIVYVDTPTHILYSSFEILYFDEGMILSYVADIVTYAIQPDMPIYEISYQASDGVREYFDEFGIPSLKIDWHGFGDYKQYLPDQ